jgi:hypothetical protein
MTDSTQPIGWGSDNTAEHSSLLASSSPEDDLTAAELWDPTLRALRPYLQQARLHRLGIDDKSAA